VPVAFEITSTFMAYSSDGTALHVFVHDGPRCGSLNASKVAGGG